MQSHYSQNLSINKSLVILIERLERYFEACKTTTQTDLYTIITSHNVLLLESDQLTKQLEKEIQQLSMVD